MKNKYVVITAVFAVWMLFFDKNDLISQWQLHHQLGELEQQKEYYQQKIEEVDNTTKALNDPARLEQFAREEYLMKKDNEDLFVIVEQDKK